MFAQKLYWGNNIKSISDELVRLDKEVVEYGIIRMSALEDNHDLSKFLPPTVVILVALLTAYNNFFQQVFFKNNLLLQFGFPLIIIIGTYIYLTILIGETQGKRESIIYFRSILQYVREQQK